MKLIKFLFICFTAFFFSCAEDNSETNQDSSILNQKLARLTNPNVLTAKNLYATIINTADYAAYKNARTAFVTKMKGNQVFFQTRAEYITWISMNLSLTTFTSVSQFTTMMDSMTSKMSNLRSKNSALFSHLDNADPDQWIVIVQPGLGTLPTIPVANACIDGCMDDAEHNLDLLDFATAELSAEFGGGYFGDAMIDAGYWIAFGSIVDNMNVCIGGC